MPASVTLLTRVSRLANVAGTQEPIYGPSAIQTVTDQAATGPSYTELTKEGLRWAAMNSTCVETQTFYITADNGYVAMVQLIYNSIAYVVTSPPPQQLRTNLSL